MINGVIFADMESDVFISRDVDENSNKKRFIDPRLQDSNNRDVTKKKRNPFKNHDRKRISSEKNEGSEKTLNELKLRRTLSEGTNGVQVATPQNLHDSEMLDVYKELNGSSKKRSCLIM